MQVCILLKSKCKTSHRLVLYFFFITVSYTPMVQSHFACCLRFDLLACAYVSWRFTSLFSVYSCFNFYEEKSLIYCKNTKQNRRKIFILLLFTNTSNSSWSKVGVKFLWDEVMRGNAAKYKKNIWLSNFSSFHYCDH